MSGTTAGSPPDITKLVKFSNKRPESSGGYCDVFRGTHKTHGVVALKLPRMRSTPENIRRRFWREVDVWYGCKHQNVLELFGVVKIGEDVYMVSPWAENGTLLEFVNSNPFTDRVHLIVGWVTGLVYLHSRNIVHGDIKGSNILIDDQHTPLLTDFGLSKSAGNMQTSTEMTGAGSTRWAAPELLNGGSKNAASDVFAAALTIYETLSGRVPFEGLNTAVPIIRAIVGGQRPPFKPEVDCNGSSFDSVWEIAAAGWNAEPRLRPTMPEMFGRLRSAHTRPPVLERNRSSGGSQQGASLTHRRSARIREPVNKVLKSFQPTVQRKFVLIGDTGCGKTAAIFRLLKQSFLSNYRPTVFDSCTTNLVIGDEAVELFISDTAGAEHDRLRSLAYEDSHLALVCFSICSPTSFRRIPETWAKELRKTCPSLRYMLVGCKKDLRYDTPTTERLRKCSEHPVTLEEGMEMAVRIGALAYFECSAVTGEGLTTVFQEALKSVLGTDSTAAMGRDSSCIVA